MQSIEVKRIDKTKDKNYRAYVSKSDRPKGNAKTLRAFGRMGNMSAVLMANEMLSPSRPPIPGKLLNQRQKRNRYRQSHSC